MPPLEFVKRAAVETTVDRLRIKLDVAASPDAVVAMATAVRDSLRAMVPDLADSANTLVIDNYMMDATIRSRTADGRLAADLLAEFVENPIKTAKKCHDPRSAARALATFSGGAFGCDAAWFRPRGKKPIAVLNDDFRKAAVGLAKMPHAPAVVRGTVVIYSPVLRIGRTDEEKRLKARIKYASQLHEVNVAKTQAVVDVLYDASKHGEVVCMLLETKWAMRGQEPTAMDIDGATIVAAHEFKPIVGTEFIQQMREAVAPMTDEQVRAAIADIEAD